MLLNGMSKDLGQLGGDLKAIGAALALFAKELRPTDDYQRSKKGVWLLADNLVGFHVQPRNRDIIMTLRGRPLDYQDKDGVDWTDLELFGRFAAYRVTRSKQLLQAAQLIWWASKLPHTKRAGTGRWRKSH